MTINAVKNDVENGRSLPVSREVGRNLRIAAWEKRVSQADLGEAIGLKQGTVSSKLRGETPITLDEFVKMAQALDIEDLGQLLPRLDSNQQPSGYLSALVGSMVRITSGLNGGRLGFVQRIYSAWSYDGLVADVDFECPRYLFDPEGEQQIVTLPFDLERELEPID